MKRSRLYTAQAWVFDGFAEGWLGPDGVLLLRLLANNAGDVVTLAVLTRLWEDYREAQLCLGSTDPAPFMSVNDAGSGTGVEDGEEGSENGTRDRVLSQAHPRFADPPEPVYC